MGKPKRSRHSTARTKPSAGQRPGDELRRQAEQHLAHGRVIPALEALKSVIEIGEAGIADWLMAGNTLLSVREFSQAIVAFDQGLTLDAEQEECRFNLAAALFQMGDVTAAANHFEFVAERYNNLKAWQSLVTIIPGCPAAGHERVLAALIREQQLDILVDLNGYSVPSRLPVLTSRLAPVCVALMNCHLSEFVASGVQEYINAAVRWATKPDAHKRLPELRRTMRPRLITSPVCQISSMVQAMEDFFLTIADKGERGEEPQL